MRCSPGQPLALAAASLLAAGAQAALYEAPVSIPGYGQVQGTAALNSTAAPFVPNWQNISFFGGIPYGADTSGANRWRDPQPARPWNGTLDASSFGDVCAASSGGHTSIYSASEDCLSINIWTPAVSAGERLPVAIWSYGDGTAPPQTTYDGAGVAGKGIVFVSYNFRAGVLGFLAHPELSETTGRNASGNWAMLDQFAALKWVHDNIEHFGGDPDHISAIGQSFGAASVYHMVNSPLAADLGIVNAISESGVRSPRDPQVQNFECGYYNLTYAEAIGEAVFASVNATTVDEARAVDTATIFNATGEQQFKPVLDYYAVPATYLTTWEEGAANKVPYITGNNADEDGASGTLVTTVADYEAWLAQEYGDLAADFLALYPAANDSQAADSESAIIRDQFRVSSWEYMAGFANSSGGVNTYTYYWDYQTPAMGSAAHASEIVYALGNIWLQAGVNYTREDFVISQVMSSYWANFIKTGDVNDGGLYGSNASLPATWAANSDADQATFHVGTAYGAIPVAASEEKIALFQKVFAASTPS